MYRKEENVEIPRSGSFLSGQTTITCLGHTNLIPGFSSKAGCEFTPTDEAFDIAC